MMIQGCQGGKQSTRSDVSPAEDHEDMKDQTCHSSSLNQDSASESTLIHAPGSHYWSMGIGIRNEICLSPMLFVAHEVGHVLHM